MRLPLLRLTTLRRSLATSRTLPELKLRVSTLKNGIRVATDPTPGHFVAAGVYVDAGSRYESEATRGASHLMDRIGFKSTANRTVEQMNSEIATLGGQFLSASSRETILYQSTTYSASLPSVLSILSDTLLNPLIQQEELDEQKSAISWEVGEIKNKPEMILPEILHEVAYGGSGLGRSLLCAEEVLEESPEQLEKRTRDFYSMWYRPERVVVAAAGVEHEDFVKLAEEYFGDMKGEPLSTAAAATSSLPPSTIPIHATHLPPTAYSQPPLASQFHTLSTAPAHYVGGSLYLPKPELDFTHVYVAYEGLSIHDPDIYALATLQILLGGGGSFSAGGPGKGMYSRLYTKVLNQYHQVDFCSSFHHCYIDSGLFGLSISVQKSFLSRTADLIGSILEAVVIGGRGGIGEAELERARNMLKSSLAMALESRMVQVEDLGRQVQVHGSKIPLSEMSASIDAVTLSDLQHVATRVLRPSSSSLLSDRKRSGKPTIVVQGEINGIGDVAKALSRRGLGGS